MKKEDEIHSKLDSRIKKIIQNEGYESYTVQINAITTKGNNYVSNLYEVDIKGKTKNGEKETNIFVKYTLPVNGLDVLLSLDNVFAKEAMLYRQIAPVFTEIQDEAGVPCKDRLRMLKSYEGCNVDAILLENIAGKGYKTLFRMDVFPLTYAELSIIELAKLHGLSFATEVKRPDFFERKIKTVTPAFDFKESWKLFAKKSYNVVLAHLSGDEKKRVEAFYPTLIEKYPKYLSGDISSVKCLCHGDCKMNNVLTRSDGDSLEAIIVDYQLIFYGSPVVDLIEFIFSASDKKFRKKHMAYLKDLYYDNLERFLKHFNIDVEQVYTRTVFEEDFKESLEYGLMFTMLFLPYSFICEKQVLDFGQSDAIEAPFVVVDEFDERMKGIIEDCIEWGIL